MIEQKMAEIMAIVTATPGVLQKNIIGKGYGRGFRAMERLVDADCIVRKIPRKGHSYELFLGVNKKIPRQKRKSRCGKYNRDENDA